MRIIPNLLDSVPMRLYACGKLTDKAFEGSQMRMYIQPSWTDAAEDHEMWSGGNGQYRGDPSINLSTFDKNGRARMEAFSDAAVEALKEKRKTSIPLTDRILPQAKRVNLLTEQMRELEIEYKSGKMSITDYTLYRNILSVKRSRAEVLLRKAISVRPTTHEDDEYADEMAEDSVETAYTINDRYSTGAPVATSCGVSWIDALSSENSLKNILKKACAISRTLVRWHQKARNYINELKAV